MLTLVIGGARSGKSEWAEHLAHASGLPVIYVATAQDYPDDLEWQRRIRLHQQRRPPEWQVQMIPFALGEFVSKCRAGQTVLIDSLGTWVSNCLEQSEADWQRTQVRLITNLQSCPSQVILVAEETGWGIVPAFSSGRLFRDRLGHLTRQLGLIAHAVYLVIAGYTLRLDQMGEKLANPSAFLSDSLNY
jgi:adenosylcobinamide kinase/adenosylcobinamide-phosphate guanylyltransferase